jgi:nucleotide-binding universal stress UspA family protein
VIKRILVALDQSERASSVLRTAGDLASQFQATLVLFRAVDVPQEFPPAAATHARDELAPKLLADARKDLEGLLASVNLRGAAPTFRVVASSEPWRAIIDEADAISADTIVIGSHGYKGLDRILGTNAARVADRAHCLVVVVHDSS